MENKTIWKGFKLVDLFEFNNSNSVKKAQKNMKISNIQDDDHKVALVTAGSRNNGVVGYLNSFDVGKSIPSTHSYTLTFNSLTIDEAGMCLYHDYKYVTQTARTFNFIDEKLKSLDLMTHKFVSKILNKIFLKSHFFGYAYKIDDDYKFPREIILLPCLEVSKNSDYIWKDNGKYFTLATDYIKQLMNKAKDLYEQKTIKLYEAEQAKYEAEQAKYEAEQAKYEEGYLKEQDSLIWAPYLFKDIFNRSSAHVIKSPKKYLDENAEYSKKHTIMNITASKENNGCTGYLEDIGEVKDKKKINLLTIASDAAYGGICFFQRDWFVSTGHNNIIEMKNNNLKTLLDSDFTLYDFLAKMITKIIGLPGINRFMRSISSDFDREIILLPVIPAEGCKEHIWEKDGEKFTLATNTMSYLYLQGQINNQQRKIDEYEYIY